MRTEEVVNPPLCSQPCSNSKTTNPPFIILFSQVESQVVTQTNKQATKSAVRGLVLMGAIGWAGLRAPSAKRKRRNTAGPTPSGKAG